MQKLVKKIVNVVNESLETIYKINKIERKDVIVVKKSKKTKHVDVNLK